MRHQRSSLTRHSLIGACVLLLGALPSACDVLQHTHETMGGQVSISGRVVGPDGQGLSDVTVRVLWSRNPSGDSILSPPGFLSLYPRRQERHEFAKGSTDAVGAFAVMLPDWFVKMEPEAMLLASKNTYRAVNVDIRDMLDSVPKVIVLAGEERIEGSITDEFGHPVAGARIGFLGGGVLEFAWTYSDELGQFNLGRSAQTNTSFVCASRSPNDMCVWAKWPAKGTPLRMILPRGSTKTVHVRDAANQPLRNQKVVVNAFGRAGFSSSSRWCEMLTDGDGVLAVGGIHDEEISIVSGGRVALDPGTESLVVMKGLRQIPLEVVDDDTGIGLSDIVVLESNHTTGGVYLGSDYWRSGNDMTFSVGRHDLSFTTVGYEPWSGVVSIDRDTQSLKIRLKRKK